jgi:hypothetical protein
MILFEGISNNLGQENKPMNKFFCLVLLGLIGAVPMDGFTRGIEIVKNKDTSDLPYREIPAYPGSFTPGNTVARIVDGLGFRYYWATNGLREIDLAFKPSKDGRTTLETIMHIYDLSEMIEISKPPVIN